MVILHCVFLITGLNSPTSTDSPNKFISKIKYMSMRKRVETFFDLLGTVSELLWWLTLSLLPMCCQIFERSGPHCKMRMSSFSTVDISGIYRWPTEFWPKTYAGGPLLRTLNFWSESEITNIGSTIFCLEMAFWVEVSAPLPGQKCTVFKIPTKNPLEDRRFC